MGPNRKSQRRASHAPSVSYAFLVETYATERFKTLGVWSMFRDEDLDIRPHPTSRTIGRRTNTWFTSA